MRLFFEGSAMPIFRKLEEDVAKKYFISLSTTQKEFKYREEGGRAAMTPRKGKGKSLS